MKFFLIVLCLMVAIFLTGGCATQEPTINNEPVDLITSDLETQFT